MVIDPNAGFTVAQFQLVLFEVILFFLIGALALWTWRRSSLIRKSRELEFDDLAFSCIAVAHADDGLLVMDMAGIIQWVNPAYCKLMGREAVEMVGRHPESFALLPDETPSQETLREFTFDVIALQKSGLETYRNQRKDGTIFWNQINTSFHTTTSGKQYAVSVCRNVTRSIEREKQLEATSRELAHSASHDTLTGVANRAALATYLNTALEQAKAQNSYVGVLHVDLDKFKKVNDSFGHSAGDAVLMAVARRINGAIRDSDMIARVGGDEFVVVFQGLQRLSDLSSVGGTLLRAVNGPVSWRSNTLDCQVSIGAALSGDDGLDADTLLLQSDFALYDVKRRERGGLATYDKALHARLSREAELAADLRLAIQDGALSFHFQPINDVKTGKICCIEALARWNHPIDGLIKPDVFVSMASDLGLLPQIDRQAAIAAMALKRQLDELGFEETKVSFNASTDSLLDPNFAADLVSSLKLHGLQPDDLIVEVRETADFGLASMDDAMSTAIKELNELGVGTILDDFGRGHAGLMHLAKLRIKGVKLDGRLTRQILTDPVIEKVYGTTIALCRDLGLSVTTEGVETKDQAERLKSLGSHTLQGCWIAPAMAEDDLIDWLNTGTDCPRVAPPLSRGEITA